MMYNVVLTQVIEYVTTLVERERERDSVALLVIVLVIYSQLTPRDRHSQVWSGSCDVSA